MSLLLDALKKAAEQKAQKSQQEVPEQRPSDETLIRADMQDISGFEVGESGADQVDHDDATELDHSEIRNRIESDMSQRIAGDETGFDITGGDHQEPVAGETGTGDDTGIDVEEAAEPDRGAAADERVAAEETGLDIPHVTRSSRGSAAYDRPAGDDTGLELADADKPETGSVANETDPADETGLDIADLTESRQDSMAVEQPAGDETGLDLAQSSDSVTAPAAREPAGDDDTGLDIPDVTNARSRADSPERADADDTGLDLAGFTESASAEASDQMQTGDDETIYFSDEDATDLSGEDGADAALHSDGDKSDISQRAAAAGEIEATIRPPDSAPAETLETQVGAEALAQPYVEDQDLSLLLVDQTDTNAANVLSDPNLPEGTAESTARADDAVDGLGLVETDDHDVTDDRFDTESTAITNQTQAIGGPDDTTETRAASATVTQSTLTRMEPTSTRTYAPDNYDRTLRPPGEDASGFFSGMKSDSDVVMTPDYAKRVFTSKTSERRAQNYKIYGAVTLVVLLAISIFGAFEYQDESNEIDTSLRSLKRDPMPGVIKTQEPEEVDLFAAEPGSSARTIEIIEAAQQDVTPDETVTAGEQEAGSAPAESTSAEVEVNVGTEVASAPPKEIKSASLAAEQVADAKPEPAESLVTSRPVVPQSDVIATTDNLHIESTRKVSESDRWLHEAYAAYQSGNYARAMELYNKVLEVEPGNRNALLARAAINVHEGYSEAAIRDYRELLLANPKDSMAMSLLLSVASYTPEDAESQLKLMIREEPDSPYLNFALANAYGAQNRWQEAQRYYFTALKNNPGDPNYAYNLAVSLEHISQPESAITYYRRALENFENGLATFSREVVDQRLQLLGKL